MAKFYFITVGLAILLGWLLNEWWELWTTERILIIVLIFVFIVINEKSTGMFENGFRALIRGDFLNWAFGLKKH